MFSLMAQVTSFLGPQAESGAIKEIFDLMDKLLDEIAASRATEKRSFDLWMEEYEKNRAAIQKLLDETQASIDQLTTEINALTKRINMLKDEKADLEE
jgi:prefoldin subunit 5